ncbi:MAG TPA: cytochrome c oxidase subunit I [Acidimicrobiales bacterium]|nr:cytochrome c oxidase subunit I [Acidimicrobiales bacterium]
MTLVAERPLTEIVPGPRPRGVLGWVTTTDHKKIGLLYMVTAFIFFLFGGLLAEGMRTQLAVPDSTFVARDTYNQWFTMHGSIMMFLFAGPFAFGLANYLVPLQIGAPDMAFPRLNALSYWLYLGGGLVMVSGFLTSRGAANFGWFAYAPLNEAIRSPGPGADLWILGVALTGFSGIFTAINLITTIFCLRAPGMVMFRVPFLTWDMLVTSFLILMAFPVLTAALAMLYADRHLGAHFFDPNGGGLPILWQHLFWFFGHPEVYILILPYFGVITDIIPTFARKPIFGYKGMVYATLAIAGLSVGVWAHHMFATGAVLLPFFSAVSLLIAVPTGIKFFNWIGTMWRGTLTFEAPMLFAVGFMLMFLLGGLTGVMLAAPPIDFHVEDTYFLVAHLHYVLFGGSVFAVFAAIYYWFPKWTGRRLSEMWARVHFVLMLIGFNLTFFPQNVLGLRGMPRRIATYGPLEHWSFLNLLSSIGAYILGVAMLPFLWNVWITWRHGERVGANPWDAGTLEWSTSSPPPEHNFDSLPPIRSERPVWDLAHPGASR